MEVQYTDSSVLEHAHIHDVAVEGVLHMNAGDGENSYAHNSTLQKTVMSKVRPVLEETVRNLYGKAFSKFFAVADLGCSSGPNSLIAISEIVDTIVVLCQQTGHTIPELLVFLNDLPGSDFNSVMTLLPKFYERLQSETHEMKRNCFVSAMPGSFYGRLFPNRSLEFVHSSYSVHWLSQVPEDLENNNGNIYMATNSPQGVFKAYLKQFQRDFSAFLAYRSEEIVPGGQMLLTFMGRGIADPTSKDCTLVWELLSKSLLQMASEGIIDEADIDSFDLPFYSPHCEEVRSIVQKEGSFIIDQLQTFEVNWDPFDNDENQSYVFNKLKSGQDVAHCIRAVTESMLATHFREDIMDDLFERFARLVGEHLVVEKTKYVNIVISMTRK